MLARHPLDTFGEAASRLEPAWSNVKRKTTRERELRVWKVENLKLSELPQHLHGQFDSSLAYIVHCSSSKFIHYWLGSQASVDAGCVAGYKSVELSAVLRGIDCRSIVKICRQTEGEETREFVDLFGGKLVVCRSESFNGKPKSGLRSIRDRLDSEEEKSVSVHAVHEDSNEESGADGGGREVLLFDFGSQLLQWHGKRARGIHKFQAAVKADRIRSQRNGRVEVIVMDEEPGDTDDVERRNQKRQTRTRRRRRRGRRGRKGENEEKEENEEDHKELVMRNLRTCPFSAPVSKLRLLCNIIKNVSGLGRGSE